MKGKIDGLEYWGCEEFCAYLEEAGLSQKTGSNNFYMCDESDAGEVIVVIENFHDVIFSNTEYYKLARIMMRGVIEVKSFANWLIMCNTKSKRKPVPQEMPLFDQCKENEVK